MATVLCIRAYQAPGIIAVGGEQRQVSESEARKLALTGCFVVLDTLAIPEETQSEKAGIALAADNNATESALQIAHEEGIDLSRVSGTGLEGRITKRDVMAYVEARDGRKEE